MALATISVAKASYNSTKNLNLMAVTPERGNDKKAFTTVLSDLKFLVTNSAINLRWDSVMSVIGYFIFCELP